MMVEHQARHDLIRRLQLIAKEQQAKRNEITIAIEQNDSQIGENGAADQTQELQLSK